MPHAAAIVRLQPEQAGYGHGEPVGFGLESGSNENFLTVKWFGVDDESTDADAIAGFAAHRIVERADAVD